VPKEPEVDGKRSSIWLDELSELHFATRTDPGSPQVKATREIGTNAIPWLLKCFQNDGRLRLSRLNWMLDKQSFIALGSTNGGSPGWRPPLGRATGMSPLLSVAFREWGSSGAAASWTAAVLHRFSPTRLPTGRKGRARPVAVPQSARRLAQSTTLTRGGWLLPVPGSPVRNTVSADSLPDRLRQLGCRRVANSRPPHNSSCRSV
jgi:hypothetical protein